MGFLWIMGLFYGCGFAFGFTRAWNFGDYVNVISSFDCSYYLLRFGRLIRCVKFNMGFLWIIGVLYCCGCDFRFTRALHFGYCFNVIVVFDWSYYLVGAACLIGWVKLKWGLCGLWAYCIVVAVIFDSLELWKIMNRIQCRIFQVVCRQMVLQLEQSFSYLSRNIVCPVWL